MLKRYSYLLSCVKGKYLTTFVTSNFVMSYLFER